MKVDEVYEKWAEDKKKYVRLSTFSAYYLLCKKHILPYWGNMEASSVCESKVQDFVDFKLTTKIKKKYIQDILICLKMILRYGIRKEYFNINTNFKVVFPTWANIPNKLDIMNKRDLDKLIQYLKENYSPENLAILIAIQTGMRIGEICGLRWNDVDIVNGVFMVEKSARRQYFYDDKIGKMRTEIMISETKTVSSSREIPISKTLLFFIKPLIKLSNGNFFIASNKLTPKDQRVLSVHYKRILDKLAIPFVKFHGLRHTFATSCLHSGVDIKTTSSILGHSKVGITMDIYMHPDNEQKKNAINKVFR
ncbi:MAG: site-specific integrase [Tannerella sp.]|jgi:integrase|nr:site-specific integrase [Tannerella sp.]